MPPEISAMHVSGDRPSANFRDDRRWLGHPIVLIGKVPSLDKLHKLLSGIFHIVVLYRSHGKSRTPEDAAGEATATMILGFSNLIKVEEDSGSHHIVGACKGNGIHERAGKAGFLNLDERFLFPSASRGAILWDSTSFSDLMQVFLPIPKSCRKGHDDREREDPCVGVIHSAGRPDVSAVKAPATRLASPLVGMPTPCCSTGFGTPHGNFAQESAACVKLPGPGLVRDKLPERRGA